MGLSYVMRRWLAPGGWNGPRFSGEQVSRFEALMREHAPTFDGRRWVKPVKGEPALVAAWDDGRSALCWYEARRGPEERELLRKCTEIFGCGPIGDDHPGE